MGGRVHPPVLVALSIEWLWEQVWDFLALGSPTSSVSRRVVKLTIPHYYLVPLPLQREATGTKFESLSCS